MYLTLTETRTRTSSPHTTTTIARPATQPAWTRPRVVTRETTTPDPLINAWTRRAMAANGFGDC